MTHAADSITVESGKLHGISVNMNAISDTVQTLAAVQTNKFFPAAASVFRKVSPIAHAAGSVVPVFDGRVVPAAEKSTLLPCVLKSIFVCPCAAPAIAADAKTHLTAPLKILMFRDFDWRLRYQLL